MNDLYPSRYITANGLRFHYVENGPADGPPVLLLHGFPAFWYSYRYQLGALGQAGFRAIAPDLTLRSTFIVGYPGETEAEFQTILTRQLPDAEKRKRATYIIPTTSLAAARQAVKDTLASIRRTKDA